MMDQIFVKSSMHLHLHDNTRGDGVRSAHTNEHNIIRNPGILPHYVVGGFLGEPSFENEER